MDINETLSAAQENIKTYREAMDNILKLKKSIREDIEALEKTLKELDEVFGGPVDGVDGNLTVKTPKGDGDDDSVLINEGTDSTDPELEVEEVEVKSEAKRVPAKRTTRSKKVQEAEEKLKEVEEELSPTDQEEELDEELAVAEEDASFGDDSSSDDEVVAVEESESVAPSKKDTPPVVDDVVEDDEDDLDALPF